MILRRRMMGGRQKNGFKEGTYSASTASITVTNSTTFSETNTKYPAVYIRIPLLQSISVVANDTISIKFLDNAPLNGAGKTRYFVFENSSNQAVATPISNKRPSKNTLYTATVANDGTITKLNTHAGGGSVTGTVTYTIQVFHNGVQII